MRSVEHDRYRRSSGCGIQGEFERLPGRESLDRENDNPSRSRLHVASGDGIDSSRVYELKLQRSIARPPSSSQSPPIRSGTLILSETATM